MENKFWALESSLNTILNIQMGSGIRMRELKKVEEYTKGLVNLPKASAATIKGVLQCAFLIFHVF